jgi:hypothetical protein
MIGNGRWWAAWVIKSLIESEKELAATTTSTSAVMVHIMLMF